MNRVILRCSSVFALLLAAAISAFAQDGSKHSITFTDMIGMHRVAESQISSDGKWVVYTVTTPDMEANRGASNIWIVSTAGGAEMQLTRRGKREEQSESTRRRATFVSALDALE